MSCFHFDLILKGVDVVSEEASDVLYEAGCSDASPVSRGGVAWLMFSREAETLHAAIRSAVADVNRAGFGVSRIEINVDRFANMTA